MGQKGFTLIELLVVISIIGILALLAIPKLGNSIAQKELDGASQQLAADIAYLQQITLNAGTDNYTMIFDNASRDVYYIRKNGTQAIKTVHMPASVIINNTPGTTSFAVTDGRPLQNPGQIQLLSNKLQQSKYIVIAPVTGRVRISDVTASE